ncbi:hypothetical protein AVEN_115356-1 [Araneus ventricosus]|uniref:Uncharacterized protein n=1 Tax=Araneus ventricosus TaxID=182803 RepID=A0A4Y1ZZ16_ARAVE|nr:hypothetical protein AVEN_115356-1 [Araneus ventricosus]
MWVGVVACAISDEDNNAFDQSAMFLVVAAGPAVLRMFRLVGVFLCVLFHTYRLPPGGTRSKCMRKPSNKKADSPFSSGYSDCVGLSYIQSDELIYILQEELGRGR